MVSRLMKVKLKEIDLTKGSADDGERYEEDLRTILSMSTKDKRILKELSILGNVSNLQDLGTEPVQISFEGEIDGYDASKTVDELFKLYDAGEPVTFESDLGAISEVNKVTIENFQVNKTVGSAYHYGYRLDLKEHRANISA